MQPLRAVGALPQRDGLLRALLLHDGELADVRILLEELGVRVWEKEGLGSDTPWDLVAFTPGQVSALRGAPEASTRLAVVHRDARTLRAFLRREGVDYVVRRPVHPRALRLLLLRTLYRGPERRREPRVAVGAPARLRAGLRRETVVLADLSPSSCRLLSPRRLAPGRAVTLCLDGAVTGGSVLRVRGEVIRATPSRSAAERDGGWEVVLALRSASRRTARRLAAVVERHVDGPAALPASDAPAEPAGERRRLPRRPFPRRVIALGEQATRVLIGRDLSLGGMRVEPAPGLRVGRELRLALHDGSRAFPLVVSARVVRDDGEDGCVLRFTRLDEGGRRYLEGLLASLPTLVDPAGGGAAGGEIVVSEVVEGEPARPRD